MAWSTRELAERAGTPVKSVRYYHQVGLLDEPQRLTNGYKQYEVRHLVRLLQITRLTDLGVPLAQIESIGSSVDDPAGALRTIDAELAATIERLQRIRRVGGDPREPDQRLLACRVRRSWTRPQRSRPVASADLVEGVRRGGDG